MSQFQVWLVVLPQTSYRSSPCGPYPRQPANQSSAAPFCARPCGPRLSPLWSDVVLATLRGGCPPQTDTFRCITSPVRHSPSESKLHAAVRLACVKQCRRVQSEPGSNSLQFNLCFAPSKWSLLITSPELTQAHSCSPLNLLRFRPRSTGQICFILVCFRDHCFVVFASSHRASRLLRLASPSF